MSESTLTTQPVPKPARAGGMCVRRRWILTLCLIAFAVVVCRDAWLDILRIVQKDDEASHILLVPLVFARLAWVRRDQLKGWQATASLWGVAIALAGVGLWLFGNIKAMQILWHFGAVLTVFGAFVCVNGLQIVRKLWPAFLVLVFLMPMPGTIRHPLALFLQNVSAQATEVVIVALGFDLVRHGNLLIINDYTVGIAEACNGMRMVSMLVLIVFAFVFAEKIRPWVRVVLVLLATPLAILCNIIRLVPTVLAYGFISPDLADQLHKWLGWVMVIASYFMLMGLLGLMRWLLLPVEPVVDIDQPWRRRKTRFNKASGEDASDTEARGRLRLAMSIGGLVITLGAAFAVGQSLPDGADTQGYHAQVRAVAEQLPKQAGGWSSVDIDLPESAVALLRPNALISRRYTEAGSGRSFALLVVQCADARDMEGHYPPNCYPTSGWTSLGRQPVELDIGQLQADSIDYRFERQVQDGLEKIGVVNLIIVPKNGFVTTMSSIRRLAGTVTDRYYGAAQVQFVFDGQWSQADRVAVVEEFAVALEPLVTVILDKVDN